MFGLWRKLRRRIRARRPFPSQWLPYLEDQVPFYAALEGEQRARFLRYVQGFIGEKHFFGAGGLEVTDEIRVVVAATAVRLVLDLDLSLYDRLTEIVVYPTHFVPPDVEGGVVFGEAHSWGVVVLSWDAVLHGLRNIEDGVDTATHEFAHVLDRADGAFDGTPALRSLGHYPAWTDVMSENFAELRKGRRRQRKVLRRYGATNEAEFFAVATEAFFEKPRQMRQRLPDLYEELKRFYGGDPAGG